MRKRLPVIAKLVSMLLALLALLPLAALAGERHADDAALAALRAPHPAATVEASAQWGDTAAAVLSENGGMILCVAEKRDGAWRCVIDNPTALWQGEPAPELLLDADDALYWRYQKPDGITTYAAFRDEAGWGDVSMTYFDLSPYQGVYQETSFWLGEASGVPAFFKRKSYQDENGNELYAVDSIPIPAGDVAGDTPLAAFHSAYFPSFGSYWRDWTKLELRQSAAKALMPSAVYLDGSVSDDAMEFLMRTADGALVLAGVTYDAATGWALVQSSPLPEGTEYGHENFTDSLWFPDRFLANVGPFPDGTWGVELIYAPDREVHGDIFCFGQNWIGGSMYYPELSCWCTHPWSDITTVDWSALPATANEAVAQADRTNWAVVRNPDPKDRLNLRAQPDPSAESLGKYYNGIPVRILRDLGEWVNVSVFGVEGYMMKAFLAFGEAADEVTPVGGNLTYRSLPGRLYERPQRDAPYTTVYSDMMSWRCADVGEGWYHAWFPDTGRSGYVLAEDAGTGNG